MQFDWIILALSINCFLTTTCFAFQLRLIYFIRACMRHSKAMKKSSTRTAQSPPPSISSAVLAVVLLNPSFNDSGGRIRHFRRNEAKFNTFLHRLSRLEVKAAKILNIAILPYCFVNLPASISGIILTCYMKKNVMSNDNSIYWVLIVMLFLRVLTLLYQLIYIPTIFAAQSKEFRLARHRCCLLCCRNHKYRRNSPSGKTVLL